MAPMNYIVMSSPRTGSSMLCAALSHSSLAGKPDEFMHDGRLKDENHPEAHIETLKQYVKKIYRKMPPPTGCSA